MKWLFKIIPFFFVVAILVGCNNTDEVKTNQSSGGAVTNEKILNGSPSSPQQLNISILVDLSDRIDPQKNPLNPSMKDRDIGAVKTLCNIYKANVSSFGTYKTKACMEAYFHPQPNDPRIAALASRLKAVCEAGTKPAVTRNNKITYRSVDSNFTNGLNQIYDLAISKHEYIGSNIWRFFKDDISKCIKTEPDYRNVLVILTDGYMYYANEMEKVGNRYTYIEKEYPHFTRFRNRKLLETDFDKQNYGFIPANSNLNNLEVLVLEVSPPDKSPIDYDIIKKYWDKWFQEMGIKKYAVEKTDQPLYLSEAVNRFFN